MAAETATADVSRRALALVGTVCVDPRQADHLMNIVARIKKGGVAEVGADTVDGLVSLAEQGLRQTRNITPVQTLFKREPCKLELTTLGDTLLTEFSDGIDI